MNTNRDEKPVEARTTELRARLAALEIEPPPRGGSGIGTSNTDASVARDAYRGAMLGTAIGDALGRPAEGRSPESITHHYGRLTEFQRWHGWQAGPAGTFTDDTQMTVCVAECLVAGSGHLDPEDLAARFMAWLPDARGAGRTCVAAVRALSDGAPWWLAGVDSAGNGAAMRAAPIGLVHRDDLDALRLDAAVSAAITHAHPMAVVSAVAHAWLIARLVAIPPGGLDPARLVTELCAAIGDLTDPGEVERESRARGHDDQPVRLVDRLAEVPGLLGDDPQDVSKYLYCGAFVLESLPMALWHFLRDPEDPERVITNAVATGYDADTVASMAGAYAGAYQGRAGLPERWRGADLEDVDRLVSLADRLYALAV